MQDMSDAQLLRDYAEHGSEASFSEIVVRHTDLVYSAALRQVSSPDLACDVAQEVFSALASKASPLADNLAGGGSLVGWLYRSTRFAALNHLRRRPPPPRA
jgi:DNA-directed RNA polymerase specialized sigma24 family protein